MPDRDQPPGNPFHQNLYMKSRLLLEIAKDLIAQSVGHTSAYDQNVHAKKLGFPHDHQKTVLQEAAILLLANHTEFKEMDPDSICDKMAIDTRGVPRQPSMRLSQAQAQTIRQSAQRVLGADVRSSVFDSHARAKAKGGDTSLFLTWPNAPGFNPELALGIRKLPMSRWWRVLAGCSARRKARRLNLLKKRFATTLVRLPVPSEMRHLVFVHPLGMWKLSKYRLWQCWGDAVLGAKSAVWLGHTSE